MFIFTAINFPLPANASSYSTANLTAAILATRCDYSDITGMPLASIDVLNTVAVAASPSLQSQLNDARASARAATRCSGLVARRFLAHVGSSRRLAIGAQALFNLSFVISLSLQEPTIASLPPSTNVVALVSSRVAAAASLAPYFPLLDASWGTANGAPALFSTAFGASPIGFYASASTGALIVPAPASGLTSSQQLGLGLGIGLGLAAILAIFTHRAIAAARTSVAARKVRTVATANAVNKVASSRRMLK